MRSVQDDGDLTARATIRNTALRLFAERGHDAVTVREIAAGAGVSPALVLHHFGSKDGLRAAVDEYAAGSFESVFTELDGDSLESVLAGGNSVVLAESFARVFPEDSPLPAYLRRLLLANDPVGTTLFRRWYELTVAMLEELGAAGATTHTADPAVRAAFLLVNDLALVLLRDQIASVIGLDPLSPQGMARWAADVVDVYLGGAFTPLDPEEPGP